MNQNIVQSEFVSISSLKPGEHAVLLTGSSYVKKKELITQLGACSANGVLFSHGSCDGFDNWTTTRVGNTVVQNTNDKKKEQMVAQNTSVHIATPPHTFLVVDEVNLKNLAELELILAFVVNGRHWLVSVIIIQKSIRNVPANIRKNCCFFAALGRFQQEKIFQILFPNAPKATKHNQLVFWTNKPLNKLCCSKKTQRDVNVLPSNALIEHTQQVQSGVPPMAPKLKPASQPVSSFAQSMKDLSLDDAEWQKKIKTLDLI